MSRLFLVMKSNWIITFVCIVVSLSCSGQTNKENSLAAGYQYEAIDSTIDVIPPWTPLQVQKNANSLVIECWGRKYIFTNGILPAQIVSQGRNILHGPMEVVLDSTGEYDKALSSIKIIKQSPGIVELEGSKTGIFGAITSNVHIEYDGLMLISLTFSSNSKQQNIKINIPYQDSIAKQYIKWVQNIHDKYSGDIPTQKGTIITSSYTPYFWIGNNDQGLFWFCETTDNWPESRSRSAIQLVRSSNSVIQQFKLGNTDRIEFGLQATPVKPLPENSKDWRIYPAPHANIVIPRPGRNDIYAYNSYPLVKNEEKYREMIRQYHDSGMRVIPYASITRVSSALPDFLANKSKWKLLNNSKMVLNRSTSKESLIYIDPQSSGYSDFIVDRLAYYLKKYNLDGYYLDGEKLFRNRTGGKNVKEYPILSYRNLQRKLYISIKKINPKAIIIAHMSANMNIPVLSYVDAYVDGEQFRSKRDGKFNYEVSESYLDVMSLGQFRAEFIGRQWGIVPFFLPELAIPREPQLKATRALAALLLIHDVHPWPIASNITIWNQMYKDLDSFGVAKSTFIPYFAENPPAEVKSNGVLVSVFKKNNTALAVVSNLTKANQTVEIRFNQRTFNWPIKKIISWPDGKVLSSSSNINSLYIPALSYQLLLLEGE